MRPFEMPSRLPDNTQNSLFTFWVPLPSFGSKELESKSQLSEFKIKSSFLSINSSVLIVQANSNYPWNSFKILDQKGTPKTILIWKVADLGATYCNYLHSDWSISFQADCLKTANFSFFLDRTGLFCNPKSYPLLGFGCN